MMMMIELKFDSLNRTDRGGSMFKQDRKESGAYEELEAIAGEVAEDEADEGPFESLLRHASEIEAGLIPGWKLDRSHPGALLWTTPSGRQYKSTLDGISYVS